ncbi:MAG: Fic family protein [Kineosporiaceae bacterium]
MGVDVAGWPPLAAESLTWDPAESYARAGLPAPAHLPGPSTYEASLPPSIADVPVPAPAQMRTAVAAATDAVLALDASTTVDLTALAGALLRSESVASSKIEQLDATQADVGLAMLRGVPVHAAAAQVAANVRAMTEAVARASRPEPFSLGDLLAVHGLLLGADPYLGGEAGRLREVQNWVGGSERSPHDALFVPPAPHRVAGLMADLVAFCRREDLPPLVLTAIAHAQLETIHPFTDGNGRTGRALVHVLLRRGGLATRTVVPVSTVLLADVGGYFDGLDDYRAGRLEAWVVRFCAATTVAATAGQRLALELADVRHRWVEAARPRRGSVVAALLDALLRQPVIDADVARTLVAGVADVAEKNLYRGLDRLEGAGVLREVTGGGRNRVWVAVDVLDLLERFESRLGRRRGSW